MDFYLDDSNAPFVLHMLVKSVGFDFSIHYLDKDGNDVLAEGLNVHYG